MAVQHIMNDSYAILFASLFPFFFVGMWLVVTTMLGALSGWFALQSQFPRGDEAPLVTFRRLSGYMGLGASLNGILTLSACPSGLRVAIWRSFGPFQRPFLVPWAEISAARKTSFFMPMAQLRFGVPEVGKLTIDAGIWQKLAAHAPARARTAAPLPQVSNPQLARGLALQWAVISCGAAAFFTFTFVLSADAPPVPVIIGFPAIIAIFFGIPQLRRYLRQRS